MCMVLYFPNEYRMLFLEAPGLRSQDRRQYFVKYNVGWGIIPISVSRDASDRNPVNVDCALPFSFQAYAHTLELSQQETSKLFQ